MGYYHRNANLIGAGVINSGQGVYDLPYEILIPSENPITEGLVLHLDAGNPLSYSGSGNTWTDMALSNNATVTGISFSSDDGGYFDYDGVNSDECKVPDSDDFNIGNNEWTLDCWCYMDVLPGNNKIYELIAHVGYNATRSVALSVGKLSSQGSFKLGILLSYGTSYINWNDSGTLSLPEEEWIYLAGGQRSGGKFINLNGVDLYTNNSTGTLSNSDFDVTIGHSGYSNRVLEGRLSIARFYNGNSLSEAECLYNYNEQKGRFGL